MSEQAGHNVLLHLRRVQAHIDERPVLINVELSLAYGQTVVVLGPNGAGKSSLAKTIAGVTPPQMTAGEIYYQGELINDWSATERARAGIFWSWQNPVAIPGVSVANLLREEKQKVAGEDVNLWEWRQQLVAWAKLLVLPESFLDREFNVGFSGGESKKLEVLQLMTLRPRLAILDELDSGLDADAVTLVRENIRRLQQETGMGVMIITHTGTLVQTWPVDQVIVLAAGRVATTGDKELLARVQTEGYGWLKAET